MRPASHAYLAKRLALHLLGETLVKEGTPAACKLVCSKCFRPLVVTSPSTGHIANTAKAQRPAFHLGSRSPAPATAASSTLPMLALLLGPNLVLLLASAVRCKLLLLLLLLPAATCATAAATPAAVHCRCSLSLLPHFCPAERLFRWAVTHSLLSSSICSFFLRSNIASPACQTAFTVILLWLQIQSARGCVLTALIAMRIGK